MFCSQCGAPRAEDAKFCADCGAQFDEVMNDRPEPEQETAEEIQETETLENSDASSSESESLSAEDDSAEAPVSEDVQETSIETVAEPNDSAEDVQTLPGLQANQVSENIGLAFLLNIIFPGAGLIYLKHPQGKKISVSSLFCLLTFFLGITLIALVCLWIYSLSKTPEAYRQLLERNTTSQIHEFSTKQEEIQPNTDASEPPSSKVEDVIAKNIFCTNCGLKLDSSTKFCPDCGTST